MGKGLYSDLEGHCGLASAIQNWEAWGQVVALPLIGYETLNKWLNLSKRQQRECRAVVRCTKAPTGIIQPVHHSRNCIPCSGQQIHPEGAVPNLSS